VTDMERMFYNSPDLTTIYVGDDWSTQAVTSSSSMFYNCTNLVGGMGTTFDASHINVAYAHIDGGPSNPGYMTKKPDYILGDVNNDGIVNIVDVTDLIDYLLMGEDVVTINLDAADVNQDNNVTIADVTELIDILLGVTP